MDNTTKSAMERKALSRVPENQRQSWYSIAFIWIGTMICIPMLLVGGLLSASMNFGSVLLACFLGFAICSILMIMVGMQGTDLGLPSSMCGTKAFGDRGSSYLLSVSIFIGQMGWFGIQTATCATAFVTLMGYWHIAFPFWLSCLIWGTVMLITAVYGFKLMKWLNYLAVPALIAMCLYGMIHAITTTGWDNIVAVKPEPGSAMGLAPAVSLVIGLFVYHELDLKGIWEAFVNAAKSTGQILIIVALASLFSWVITVAQIPQTVSAMLQDNIHSKVAMLMVINIILLIAGTFIDTTSAIVIFAPLFIPICKAMNVDLVHFGMIMTVNLTIGMCTPPLGVCLFVSSSIAKISLKDQMRDLLPMLAVLIGVLLLVTYIPGLTLWLPSLFK